MKEGIKGQVFEGFCREEDLSGDRGIPWTDGITVWRTGDACGIGGNHVRVRLLIEKQEPKIEVTPSQIIDKFSKVLEEHGASWTIDDLVEELFGKEIL